VFVSDQGKVCALNAAMKLATGTIFLFTDDDARFPEDWLTCGCRAVEQRSNARGGNEAKWRAHDPCEAAMHGPCRCALMTRRDLAISAAA
jgi:hypothetical protein